MPYPKYVSRYGHGQQSMVPPGLIAGADMYAFLVPGDRAKMQAFVDAQLNVPAARPLHYRVIGSHVVAVFLSADRLTSEKQQVGWVPDHEFALFMILVAFDGDTPKRLLTYNPYIVVDTGIAMTSGRESWGFPKEPGRVTIPDMRDRDRRFIAQARLFPKLSNEIEGVLQPWFQVRSHGPWEENQVPESHWGSTGEARRGIEELLGVMEDEPWDGAVDLVKAFARDLAAHEVPQVNLKQFRDAADAGTACYQAIIESTSRIQKFHGGGLLLGKYVSRVTPAESHPLAEDLGLASTGDCGPGFWIRVDFTADPGKEVWKA
jgi:hypothetical protein